MRPIHWKRIVWITTFFLLWWIGLGATSNVALDIYPKVGMAPLGKRAAFRVRWRIERHEDNRGWSVACISEDYYSSSHRQMDGNSPITYERIIELPSGYYVLEACVYRLKEKETETFCDRKELEVL